MKSFMWFVHLGWIYGWSIIIGSLFINIIYNLDLRTYIIEPFYESLPTTMKEVDMKDLYIFYTQRPVDMDILQNAWMSLIQNPTKNGSLQLPDLIRLVISRPDVAVSFTKDQFLTHISHAVNQMKDYRPLKINLKPEDTVRSILVFNKHFNSIYEPLRKFILHITVN